MKGITGNPALDAYQRAAIRPVSSASQAQSAEINGALPNRVGHQAAKLSISDEARALSEAGPQVDAQKVDTLRNAIRSGTFQVDAKAVAEKMLASLG